MNKTRANLKILEQIRKASINARQDTAHIDAQILQAQQTLKILEANHELLAKLQK